MHWEAGDRKLVIKNTGEMSVVDRMLNDNRVRERWSSKTKGNTEGVTLVVQNDNNLVLFDKGGVPIWDSNTQGLCKTMVDYVPILMQG